MGNDPQQLQFVGLPPASYANVANVQGNPEELFITFAQSDGAVVTPVGRVCISLSHAKRLVKALQETLDKHEENFGTIVADPIEKITPQGRVNLADLLQAAGVQNEQS